MISGNAGAPEIVEKTAKLVRLAWDCGTAVDILKEIIKTTPILISKSGTKARISSKSAGKTAGGTITELIP
jgi:hypothetical protein